LRLHKECAKISMRFALQPVTSDSPLRGGWLRSMSRGLFEAPASTVLPVAVSLSVLIAVLDYITGVHLSLGLMYTIPIVLASQSLSRFQVVLASLVFALLREQFSPYSWAPHAESRVASGFATFAVTGLLAGELFRGRRRALQYSRDLKEQHDRRVMAESELRMLVDSSPAAIVTLDARGCVDRANQAAHDMFAVSAGLLPGQAIHDYLPTVANLLQSVDSDLPYRSATSCRGRRADGESFLACIWFATYPSPAGRRMAAIITDASEDLRDWQETSLQSLLRSSRVLVGSVSHEIRNICAAISVVQANLGRLPGVAQTEDYSALGTLAQALSRLTTVELQSFADQPLERVNLDQLLDEFRIVVAPTLEAEGIELRVEGVDHLPPVQGDRHGFLQVLLNLARNSTRALQGADRRLIAVRSETRPNLVILRFSDSGPGVPDPSRLFQPFQPGAESMGLGLFVSRAIIRACGGELYHEPSDPGCTICLRLIPILTADAQTEEHSSEISV
jgi:two-component system sensor kinase FixL